MAATLAQSQASTLIKPNGAQAPRKHNMKHNSWTKEWLVIAHSDYDNTWHPLTIHLTLKQATAFAHDARYIHRLDKGKIKVVTDDEFEKMGVTA
jgi:hypothetical protein